MSILMTDENKFKKIIMFTFIVWIDFPGHVSGQRHQRHPRRRKTLQTVDGSISQGRKRVQVRSDKEKRRE